MTVSPDDILAWDLPNPVDVRDPTQGLLGTYGYNEPLAYAPAVFRRRYRWVAPSGSASVQVQVLNGKVINGQPQPFTGDPGARISLNGFPMGSTDPTGFAPGSSSYFTVASGNYDVQAEWSPCGSPQPPVPAANPQSVNPYGLPVCGEGDPNARCQALVCSEKAYLNTITCVPDCSELAACYADHPNGFRDDGSTCDCQYVCACEPYQPPVCNAPLQTASRPVTLAPGDSKTVMLTLCEGPIQTVFDACANDTNCASGSHCNQKTHYCENPEACVQSCTQDSECYDVLMCDSATHLCQPRPLVVQAFVQLAYRVPIVDGDGTNISVFEDPIRCDPDQARPNQTNGQTVSRLTCIQWDDEDVATLVFNSTCTRGSDGSIRFSNELSIDEGCGSNREAHPKTHASWVSPLAPIPNQGLSHDYEGCYGNSGDKGCNDPDADIVVDAHVDFFTRATP